MLVCPRQVLYQNVLSFEAHEYVGISGQPPYGEYKSTLEINPPLLDAIKFKSDFSDGKSIEYNDDHPKFTATADHLIEVTRKTHLRDWFISVTANGEREIVGWYDWYIDDDVFTDYNNGKLYVTSQSFGDYWNSTRKATIGSDPTSSPVLPIEGGKYANSAGINRIYIPYEY